MRPIKASGMKTILLLLFTSFVAPFISAQTPAPAGPQTRPIALVGGTAHLGNGQVIENAVVTFKDGKIQTVADLTNIRINRGEYTVIDTTGKHLYPGFILASSQAGLTEVGSVRAMNDNAERGEYNPNVRALSSYNTDSEYLPTLRFNGILTAQSTPTGGIISGTSSIVQLDAWNWEDAAYVADDGVHLNWPSRTVRRFNFSTFRRENRPNDAYDATLLDLERMFSDARQYGRLNHKQNNLKLASLQGLFSGKQRLFLHATDAKSMIEGVLFAQKHGVEKSVIIGGTDAMYIKDFLKKHQIPIVLTGTHRLPDQPSEDVNMPYLLPSLLQEAGIPFGITVGGLMGSRNLPFHAGTAAAYGLDKEQALAAVTGNVAKILGISDRVGTLEAGKDATLFISQGDALDMRGNIVEKAFIMGRDVPLSGMQQRLYDKYHEKYKN